MPYRGIHALPAGPPEFSDLITVYIVRGDKMNVMIDAGVANSVLDTSFLDRLDLVIITHLHIDHIGLLPEIIETYKNVKIAVKSGFKKYLTTDEGVKRLNETASRVLGDLYDIYGAVRKIDESKVIEVNGGDKIDIGEGKYLEIINTPGHAKHHISVLLNDILFTGDSAGAYFGDVIIPTSPSPFNYDEYIKSLKLQIDLKPRIVGLAHGGLVNPEVMSRHLEQMIKKDFNVDVDIGGIAGEILRKQIEVNLRGLRG
ncbi:MAG: MBL fold metallo-hydrolase [Sulfolobaceae archaeon]|nr:MBL fold metallo-hydrolase [Sulfolobaceae archaeon]